MEGEIIFYNGFNLLVDLIIAGAVFYFTRRFMYRAGWHDGYSDGLSDVQDGLVYLEERDGELEWVPNIVPTQTTTDRPNLFVVPESK
jgi:hypothetical protein